MILGVLAAFAAGEPERPTDQTLVYYNARMALREGRPLEAVKLWLLRNAVEDATREVSAYDVDFRTVTWAALGDMGICQDGLPLDEDASGLWPIAMHNWMVRNRGKRTPPTKPRPFDAFEVDRQHRFIAIADVLDAEELRTVKLFRGRCVRPRLLLFESGGLPNADLADRKVLATFLKYLLLRAKRTLDPEVVRGQAAIDARLFDLHLQLAAIAEREARQRAREQGRTGTALGLSRPSVDAMREDAPKTTLDPDSPAGVILRASVEWPISEWLSLSADRRLFVYDQAVLLGVDPARLDAIALGVIDALVAAGEGEEVERWIAHRALRDDPARQEDLWGGQRGRDLMALDDASGFRERSVVALHRGVQHLEGGDLPGSLRAFAYALQHAPESRNADAVQGLSRRWLSYVAAQFVISDDLLVTLQALVPRRDYSVILEDLMWRAAFHADQASFERGLRYQVGRGALERRVELLVPLAKGDLGKFDAGLQARMETSPSETVRFLEQLVERLEREDTDVRTHQLATLTRIRALLEPLADETEGGRQARKANVLLARTQAIIEGLSGLSDDASLADRARALSPGAEAFAGAVRLAPSDALPWPFRPAPISAPSVFQPLELTPVEWRTADGELVLGWRIGERLP